MVEHQTFNLGVEGSNPSVNPSAPTSSNLKIEDCYSRHVLGTDDILRYHYEVGANPISSTVN